MLSIIYNFKEQYQEKQKTKAYNKYMSDLINESLMNEHLRKYRAQYKNHFWRMLVKDIKKSYIKKYLRYKAGNNLAVSYQRRNYYDKAWIHLLLKDYHLYRLISEGEGKKVPFYVYGSLFDIDEKIAPVVFALNQEKYITYSSCEGNQQKKHSYTAYLMIDNSHKTGFPSDMLAMLDKAEVKYTLNYYDFAFLHEATIHAKDSSMNKKFVEVLTQWAMSKNIHPATLQQAWKKTT